MAKATATPENRHAAHAHWTETGELGSRAQYADGNVSIDCPGSRETVIWWLEGLRLARSNPKSPNYGKHMSARDVIDYFSPPESSVETVTEWLKDAGIGAERVSQSANKQVSVAQAAEKSPKKKVCG